MPYATPISLADLRERLADRWEGVPFWDVDDANDALNETLLWWNLMTGVWRRRETIPLAKLAMDYALSSSLTYPLRVELNGRPLTPGTIFSLDYTRPGWRGWQTDTGGDVPRRVETWAPVSLMEIVVVPKPIVDADLGTLVIDGVCDTPQLALDTDLLELDEGWLVPLLNFSLHLAAYKLGGPRWRTTIPFRTDFFAAAAEQNIALQRSQLFRTYAGLDLGKLQRPRGGQGQDAPGAPAGSGEGSDAAAQPADQEQG